jgi:hypothetical protein
MRVEPPGYVAGHGRRSPGSLSVMSNDMVIVFQRGNEAPEAFPLGKPGGNISIAWGEPTRRAAIWKVVANPKGDVYVMERKTGRYLKASLHKKVWRMRGLSVLRGGARWSSRSSR